MLDDALKSWLVEWLGNMPLTPAQRTILHDEVDWIEQHIPDQHIRDAAMSAVVQYLLEGGSCDSAARLAAARTELAQAMAAAQQTARMMVLEGGATEVAAAETLGLDRMTVRKALGKR